MKTTFVKLPAIKGHECCGTCHCGPVNDLEMERGIAVGFGSAGYSKDGEVLWQENGTEEWEDIPKVQHVEDLAKANPDHDWRIYFFAPLYESEYQRQGDGIWVLVSKGQGFA